MIRKRPEAMTITLTNEVYKGRTTNGRTRKSLDACRTFILPRCGRNSKRRNIIRISNIQIIAS